MRRTLLIAILLCPVTLAAQSETPRPAPEATTQPQVTAVQRIRDEAKKLAPLFQTPGAREFLTATSRLPNVESRTIYAGPDRTYLSKAAWEKLPETDRKGLREITIPESRYYNTLYGTPLFYGRLIELLGEHGVTSLEGKKLLDFGYGTIGHLRLMANAGADVTGVDVDTLLKAIYCESADTGVMKNPQRADGRIELVEGRFPTDAKVREAIGEGFDLFTSKNTLKNGYIHPAEKVDPRMTIDLGVSDEAYVQAVHAILKPGGLALIYNLCPAPAPAGKPYIPWADGRCPFPREMWEANGFEVLAFDKDDSDFARKMGRALGWDAAPMSMDLEGDMFAHWTLVRRKR
ncbi:MAG: hypothetical protein KDA33_09520 [Phycisphaerales bacterium]|nr:hypothetical protein [Phycisphaerales bacterium]